MPAIIRDASVTRKAWAVPTISALMTRVNAAEAVRASVDRLSIRARRSVRSSFRMASRTGWNASLDVSGASFSAAGSPAISATATSVLRRCAFMASCEAFGSASQTVLSVRSRAAASIMSPNGLATAILMANSARRPKPSDSTRALVVAQRPPRVRLGTRASSSSEARMDRRRCRAGVREGIGRPLVQGDERDKRIQKFRFATVLRMLSDLWAGVSKV